MPSATELRELDDEELDERLVEYRKELLNLRFQLATGQLDNAARVGQVRRDVARVLTLLRDREIALAEGREPTIGRARPVVPVAPRRVRRAKAEDAPEVDRLEDDTVSEDDVEVIEDAETKDTVADDDEDEASEDEADETSDADGEDE